MARNDGDRSSVRSTLVLVLFLALVGGSVAVWRYDLVDRLRDRTDPSAAGPRDPAVVAPPPGVVVPDVEAPAPVAVASAPTTAIGPAAVRRTLNRYLRDKRLGRHVLAEVAPLDGDGAAVTIGGGADTAIPASTTKIVTSAAALLALGPDHVFTTEVRRRGNVVTLVGGGDPFLERGPLDEGQPWPYPVRADLRDLARRTAEALQADGVRRVRLDYDESLFDGPQVNSTWEPDYVSSGEASPTSALWIDQGRAPVGLAREADPAAAAARAFADELGAAGIVVRGTPTDRAAPDSAPIASVASAPLGEIVQRVLDVSDDDAAEALLRHVGVATAGEGSIEAGRAGVRRLLRRAGVDVGDSVLHDGSGLSRANRMDPSLLVSVLQLAGSDDHPGLRSLITGLPVAGFTGSLSDRMDQGPPEGRGRVRAKTGTLSNVSSLAGLATDLEGNVMVFVLMVDRVADDNALVAQAGLDSAAAALGACACGG